jgi:hypothetical protein
MAARSADHQLELMSRLRAVLSFGYWTAQAVLVEFRAAMESAVHTDEAPDRRRCGAPVRSLADIDYPAFKKSLAILLGAECERGT